MEQYNIVRRDPMFVAVIDRIFAETRRDAIERAKEQYPQLWEAGRITVDETVED